MHVHMAHFEAILAGSILICHKSGAGPGAAGGCALHTLLTGEGYEIASREPPACSLLPSETTIVSSLIPSHPLLSCKSGLK